MMVIAGLSLFVAVCALALLLAFLAQRERRSLLTQSLLRQSVYIRFMQDKQDLNRLGLAQQFVRAINGFSSFGASFSNMSILCAAAFLMAPAVAQGGPAVIGFGWPIIACFSLLLACSLASFTAAFPTAGGSYHWVIAYGRKLRRTALFSGWLNIAGHTLRLSMMNLIVASWCTGLLARENGSAASGWLFWLLLLSLFGTQLLAHSGRTRSLGRLFAGTAWLQAILVIGIAVGLSSLLWPGYYPLQIIFEPVHPFALSAAKASGSQFLIGLLLLASVFLGTGSAGQMAEETADPGSSASWGIYLSVVYTFIFGFVLFTLVLIHWPEAPAGMASWGSVTQWLTTLAGNSWIATIFILGLVWAGWSSGLSALASSSRTWFAMARDGAMPLSKWSGQLAIRTQVPIRAGLIIVVAAIALIAVPLVFAASWERVVEKTLVPLALTSLLSIYLSYVSPIVLRSLVKGSNKTILLPAGPFTTRRPIIDLLSLVWLLASIACAVMLLSVPALLCSAVVLLVIGGIIEWKLRWMPGTKQMQQSVGAIRFSQLTMDEILRIERKYPQS